MYIKHLEICFNRKIFLVLLDIFHLSIVACIIYLLFYSQNNLMKLLILNGIYILYLVFLFLLDKIIQTSDKINIYKYVPITDRMRYIITKETHYGIIKKSSNYDLWGFNGFLLICIIIVNIIYIDNINKIQHLKKSRRMKRKRIL